MAIDVGWRVLVIAASASISALLAHVAWQNRTTRGSRELAVMLGLIALWNTLFLLPVAGGPIELTVFIAGTMVGVLAAMANYLLLFTLEYSGRGQWVLSRRRILLLAHPTAVFLLVLTDQSVDLAPSVLQQSLLIRDVTLAEGPLYRISLTWGSAFWIHLAYSYLLLAIGAYSIVYMIRSSNSIYTGQALLLASALLPPWLSSILSIFFPLFEDTLGIAFCLTGLLLFVAVRSHKLSDITPVARDAVLDSIDGGVLVLDNTDRIVDANPAAIDSLDLKENVIGQPAAEGLDHLDDLWDRYADVYETRDEVAVETVTGWRHFVVEISPLHNRADESGTARTVLINDVTEQKQREQELENQTERLEQFASLVSHDLRNPLTVAQGHLELIEEESEHVDWVAESHERMDTLIDEVLTIARSGKRVTEMDVVPLETVARDAWRMVDTGSVSFSVETEYRVEADSERLKRAFENLFRNAIEHGGATVETIRVGVLATESQIFEPEKQGIFVEDDGRGIPPDKRDAVLEAGHTTNPDGTGLGLSIVESVAEAHGWTVAVAESTSGGARFELRGASLQRPPEQNQPVSSE